MTDKKRILKVRVVLVVDVDVDDYRLNYGSDSADEIRDAIKYAAADGLRACLADGIVNVAVKS